jgi:lipopolysaccharide export system protein LptA
VTPTQQAKGDHATYLADNNTITLTGNVILTQDKNVAAGDKLVIDRNTGHSTLTSAPGKGGTPNRVRAVLYPSQPQNPAAPGATTPAQPPKPGHP